MLENYKETNVKLRIEKPVKIETKLNNLSLVCKGMIETP